MEYSKAELISLVPDHSKWGSYHKFLPVQALLQLGRAIAHAVCRWLPTAVTLVRARIWSSGICDGQSGTGAGIFRVLRFLLPIFIAPNSPSSQSPGPGTIGQKWSTCRVDQVWTPPPTMRL
jgi:hypothetical protein